MLTFERCELKFLDSIDYLPFTLNHRYKFYLKVDINDLPKSELVRSRPIIYFSENVY